MHRRQFLASAAGATLAFGAGARLSALAATPDEVARWFPKPIGWAAGEAPVPAKGLTVSRFAEGLDHPRVLYTLPNGDVIAAEADAPAGNMGGGLSGKIGEALMKIVTDWASEHAPAAKTTAPTQRAAAAKKPTSSSSITTSSSPIWQ